VDPSRQRRYAEAAIVGIVLYVVIDGALVFLRPSLSVLHNAESDYGSKGSYGWVMDGNFVLRGLLSLSVVVALALAVGQRARIGVGLGLLAVWAVASGLLAFFPDDPVGTKTTGAGKVHFVLAGIAFLGVLVGSFATVRALRADERFAPVRRRLLALAWAAVVAIALLGHAHLRPHSLGGLYEKLFLGCELAWFAVLAAWIARLEPSPTERASG